MKTVYFRNIFLDSEINAIGNGQKSRISFPSTAFSVRPNQFMKLVLTSFEMRRNWYSINDTNNRMSLYNFPTAGDYKEVKIEPGSYRSFDSLASAIQTAVIAAGGGVLAGTVVSFDQVSRKFTIDLTNTQVPDDSFFVCFQVKQSPAAPTGVSPEAYFNDSNEIVGGRPTRDGWITPVNAFGNESVGKTKHISPYVGALNSIETIFLRTSLQTNNYQTVGFERNLRPQSGLTPTDIFARIPLSRAYYNDEFEIIQFEDPNELFTILLQQTQLSDMVFAITDHAGRPLQEVAKGQASDGNLSFKMSFRWEIIEQDTPQGEYRIKPPPLENVRITP
jgi:hypothetical protein